MAIALKRMCLSLSDALETQAVLEPEEPYAALPHAMPAACVFVLFVAAIFVAAIGCGLACVLWPDPPGVRPARLPWWDLICFQLGMIVFVFGLFLRLVRQGPRSEE